MQLTEKTDYTPEEYLALEEVAESKYEYIDREIIPMAGGSIHHNRITLNLSANLNFAFRQQNYEVFMVDIRLWIPQRRIYTYPDVMIVQGEPEYFDNRTDTITNPQVIIEVLSDSTQGYDREGKFQAYRTIPTLQEYLLIDQTQIYIEHFSKTGNKQWTLQECDQEDKQISLTAVGLEIPLEYLYNKVQFPE